MTNWKSKESISIKPNLDTKIRVAENNLINLHLWLINYHYTLCVQISINARIHYSLQSAVVITKSFFQNIDVSKQTKFQIKVYSWLYKECQHDFYVILKVQFGRANIKPAIHVWPVEFFCWSVILLMPFCVPILSVFHVESYSIIRTFSGNIECVPM